MSQAIAQLPAPEPMPALDMDAMAVRGRVEMSPAEAFLSARDNVLQRARADLERESVRIRAERQPFWMPDFVADRAMRDLVGRVDLTKAYAVLDRADDTHDHEWGQSYRTTLIVSPNAAFVDETRRVVDRQLQQARSRFLAVGAGTLGFWGGLAVLMGWLNRLSRGYMSRRLGVIGVSLGVAVPTVAFLI